ncbi:MAG: metal-sensing transcriptional repressor [Clostridia bacterium]|nr:metal-sensing transcriptional repressor [Clostridia bacterium]
MKRRTEEEKTAIINRLKRITGQMNGIVRMVEEDRYCDEVLIQLSAVDKAIKALANMLLDAHMHTCLVEHIKAGELDAVDEVVDLFKRFQ